MSAPETEKPGLAGPGFRLIRTYCQALRIGELLHPCVTHQDSLVKRLASLALG
jgi:hypothetical protein